MRYSVVPSGIPWRFNGTGIFLIVLGLVGISLSSGVAEIRNEGARVQVHRDRTGIPRIADLNKTPPSSNSVSPAPVTSPDNDLGSWPSYLGEPATPPNNRPPYGVSPTLLPWNQASFAEYNESEEMSLDLSLFTPVKYRLEATSLPVAASAEGTDKALLIVHFPRYALLWIDDGPVPLTNETNYLQTPRLNSSKKYSYSVRAAWIEDGHWVSQTEKVAVQARMVRAIYLRSVVPAAKVAGGK